MSQKPDYYSVLGVEKTATFNEIKAACTKLTMRNHPDRMRNKSVEEQRDAETTLRQVDEAYKVLSDAGKRDIYDRFGHNGLEQAQGAKSGSSYDSGKHNSSVMQRTCTPEDAFDFFDRGTEEKGPSTPPITPAVDRAAAAERRRLAQLARRANPSSTSIPERVVVPAPVAEPIGRPSTAKVEKTDEKPSNSPNFDAVARDVRTVQDRASQLGRDAYVEVPLDTLTRFRDNVQDMLTALDAAIARKKQGGPRP